MDSTGTAICTPPPDRGPAGTVLVVEDDRSVSSGVELLLCHYGYVVVVAETLAAARRMLAAGADPDVILLDLNLPDGSGLDLLEQVRGGRGRARVAVLTAEVDPAHLRRLKSLRPDWFHRKPVNFLDVLAALRGEPPPLAAAAAGPRAA